MKKTRFFEIYELVCPDVYNRDGNKAFRYFRPVLLDFLDWFREEIDMLVIVNDWYWGGRYDERGYRCNLCPTVTSKMYLYVSGHMLGAGVDFVVKGMNADTVKKWIGANIHRFFEKYKYRAKCRMEDSETATTWTHIDFYEHELKEIIQYFGHES